MVPDIWKCLEDGNYSYVFLVDQAIFGFHVDFRGCIITVSESILWDENQRGDVSQRLVYSEADDSSILTDLTGYKACFTMYKLQSPATPHFFGFTVT